VIVAFPDHGYQQRADRGGRRGGQHRRDRCGGGGHRGPHTSGRAESEPNGSTIDDLDGACHDAPTLHFHGSNNRASDGHGNNRASDGDGNHASAGHFGPPVPRNSDSTSLRAQANIDSPVVTTWAKNQWFPQLSSKQPGTVDDGIQWDYNSIWQEHLQLRQHYGAKLLWSGDWPRTFKKPDYWVTIAWFAFPDAAGAWEWCKNHDRDSHHCYPTQIQ
jgi:serine/threonine-protein kinase